MKFTLYLTTTLLALCLVLQPSLATYSSKLMLSKEVTAVIEDLQSAIESLKDALNSVKNAKQIEALTQISDDDGAYIQQRSSTLLQLQLALRDLIRAIARLERSIRWERRG